QCLGLDLRQALLGHPGIMLQGHGGDGIADPVAHQTDEAGKPTDIAPPLAETRELGPDVEVGFLDADHERDSLSSRNALSCVIPAKAGIQGNRRILQPWIPAFAGMTVESE